MINLRTKAARQRDRLRQLRERDALERVVRIRLSQEFRRVTVEAMRCLPDQMTALQEATHRAQLTQKLGPAIHHVALAAAEGARQSVKTALGRIETKVDTSDELDKRVLKWARKHTAEKVVDISKTTRLRINRLIARGMDDGKTVATIARDIRRSTGFDSARAETIARTETAAAYNTGQQVAMEEAQSELGVTMKKVWVSTQDDRTRPTHSDADGQTVGLEDSFSVGNIEISYPGDPDGEPEEIINCRCAVTYEVE